MMKTLKITASILLIIMALFLTSCTEENPGYSILIDSSGNEALIGEHTNAIVTITYPYYQLYMGNMYTTSRNGILGNGESRDTLIVTSNSNIDIHLTIKIETEAEASYTLYEDTVTDDDGTPLIPVNKNRQSLNATVTDIFIDPVITDVGNVLIVEHWGSGKTIGGEERSEIEWILDYNTKYLLRITNQTTSNNYVSTVLIWYEH